MISRGRTDRARRGPVAPGAARGAVSTGAHEREPEVYTITSAGDSLSDDQARRAKRYLIQMGIRMACFIGAVFVDGPLMWVLLGAAVVLPYVAVVNANAGRERRDVDASPMSYRQLASGPSAPATDGGHRG